MPYEIVSGLKPPLGRKARRSTLVEIIALARRMRVGDAVALSMSDAQLMRIVLLALDFECVNDAQQSLDKTKVMVFKLDRNHAPLRP